MKKYELTDKTIEYKGRILHQIRALKKIRCVEKGWLGGYIEDYKNLSQEGDCWIFDSAKAYDDGRVSGNAFMSGTSEIYDNAEIYQNASAGGSAMIYQHACVFGNSTIDKNSKIHGDVFVEGIARILSNADLENDGDYIVINGVGSRYSNTTFYRKTDGGIYVVCGCFEGDLDQFKKKAVGTHGNNKFGKEYLKIIDLVKIHFSE